MNEKKVHLVGRIDQVVRDFFAGHPDVNAIQAKDLMELFITKEIFTKDHRNGLPIRDLLRDLDAANQLSLIRHSKVIRNRKNRSWYFERQTE